MPPAIDLSKSFGAVFIALIVCVGLFGLTLGQTWLYFWHYWSKDTKALRSFVTIITAMDTIHTAMVVYGVYWYLVLNFANVEALGTAKWFWIIPSNFCGLYTSAIQLYYTRQIYLVSQSIIPVVIILTLLVSGNILGFYIMTIELTHSQVISKIKTMMWLGGIGNAECVVVDVMIAGTMCWALYRKKTGFARTDSMIMTLMAYTINTGLLTSLIGAGMTISFLLAPQSMISLAIFLGFGKCYVNSVLAMLNSRGYVRGRGSPETPYNLSSIRVAPPEEALESNFKAK